MDSSSKLERMLSPHALQLAGIAFLSIIEAFAIVLEFPPSSEGDPDLAHMIYMSVEDKGLTMALISSLCFCSSLM